MTETKKFHYPGSNRWWIRKKNPFRPIFVIPAKAGIQLIQVVLSA